MSTNVDTTADEVKRIILWFFTTKIGGAVTGIIILLWAIGRLTMDAMDTS